MKIGILTFINTINYGALFQAYALEYSLNKMGHKAEIIHYVNKFIENKENNNNKLSPKWLIRKLIIGDNFKRKAEKFRCFESSYMSRGDNLNDKSINNINQYYDRFITGSDQVWNLKLTNGDLHYFLDFVKDRGKKISYAPSFGNVPFVDKYKNRVNYLLAEFSALSVREASGASIIKTIIDRDVQIVVDPTLLLSKLDWAKLIIDKPSINHYILVYFPNNKKQVFSFVNKLSKKTGCKIVYLSISPRIYFGVDTIYDASPQDWLSWIYYADYVVTGSFHGTAFSLNFEKQFFYEPSGEGSRIDNIVSLTGTKDRDLTKTDIYDVIDYNKVRTVLDFARKQSFCWLKNAIENE